MASNRTIHGISVLELESTWLELLEEHLIMVPTDCYLGV